MIGSRASSVALPPSLLRFQAWLSLYVRLLRSSETLGQRCGQIEKTIETIETNEMTRVTGTASTATVDPPGDSHQPDPLVGFPQPDLPVEILLAGATNLDTDMTAHRAATPSETFLLAGTPPVTPGDPPRGTDTRVEISPNVVGT